MENSRSGKAQSIARARELRRVMTDAERRLWSKLRNRRFGNFKFRRQVTLEPFIVDFVCMEQKLVLELDGGQHTLRQEYDAERTHWLEQHGFHVVRFWNHQLWEDSDAVDELIWTELHRLVNGRGEERTPSPRPSPTRGEGE
jgi:very-short-patch-repair endonuclease